VKPAPFLQEEAERSGASVSANLQASPALPWSRLLWLALGYFAIAQLSLALAIPPGYAAPLWPAAGLALVALSALLAAGAALQAVLGARLVRRFLGAAEPLSRERHALAFLALGGPLTCLLSATVGVAALYPLQGLPAEALAGTWVVWWAADTTGAGRA